MLDLNTQVSYIREIIDEYINNYIGHPISESVKFKIKVDIEQMWTRLIEVSPTKRLVPKIIVEHRKGDNFITISPGNMFTAVLMYGFEYPTFLMREDATLYTGDYGIYSYNPESDIYRLEFNPM